MHMNKIDNKSTTAREKAEFGKDLADGTIGTTPYSVPND